MRVPFTHWQTEVAQDNHRFRIICAGRRSGKSTLAQWIVLKWATEKPGLYWIVSPTYRSGKMIHWLSLARIIPQDWIAKKNEVELSITLKNGSIISLKGAENPDTLRGVKLNGLVIDEIASIRNWVWLWNEVLRATLTDYAAPALFISTPKGYNHFFELYEQGQREGDYKSWKFTSYDNPYVPKEEIEKAKVELSFETFSQEYLAEFTRITGIIYREFNPDVHVHLFEHTFNSHAEYLFGLDFAVRGYTATALLKIDSQGDIWILDEYKIDNETAKTHATAIRELLLKYADFDKWTGYADPAGFAKNQQAGDMIWSIADEFKELDFPIVPANNIVHGGITYVRELFRKGKIHIHPRCVLLVDELQQYQWKDQPVTQIGISDEPEKPRKINDHLVDALRYALYSKPIAPDEEEVKQPTLLPAVWPMVNVYEKKEEDSFEEISFGIGD